MQLLSHIYSDLIGPFLQSAFSLCYLGCESNILFLENSLEGEVNSFVHPCIIVGVLSHVLIFFFITWLLEGSLEFHQSYWPYFPAPDVTSRVTHVFILSCSALVVLVVRGGVCKIACEISI